MKFKHKTMRLFAGLLASCMAFSQLPLAAAADTGEYYSIPISKTVVVNGDTAPAAETFYFQVDLVNADQDSAPDISDLNISGLSIDTNGAGTYTGTLLIAKTPQTIDIIDQAGGLILSEECGDTNGWTYDSKTYVIGTIYDENQEASLGIVSNGAAADDQTASFTNEYESTNIVLEIPFIKTVERGGAATPPAQEFTIEIAPCDADADISSLQIANNTIDTDGENVYTGTLTITGDASVIDGSGGLKITEKNAGAADWEYDEQVYIVRRTDNGASIYRDDGPDMNPAPVRSVDFTNTYTAEEIDDAEMIVEIPIVKIVKQGGTDAPGVQTFTFEVASGNTDVDFSNLTISGNTIQTNGAGEFTTTLTITGTATVFGTADGLKLTEKNDGLANWTYDSATYTVYPDMGNGLFITEEDATETDLAAATFTNIYTASKPSGGGGGSSSSVRRYTITATTDDGGSISPEGKVRVAEGSSKTFTIGAEEGFRVADVLVDDKSIGAVTEYTFRNVKADHTIHVVIGKKAELNREDHFAFLVGYPNGTFGPDRNMTRGEVTAMFSRLLTEQMDPDKQYRSTFNDVPDDYWAASCIGYMQQFGVISGYPDGTFRPDAPVSRAEFASIASRFEKLSEGSKSFSDVPASHWAAKYINFAATRGWVSGYSDGTFRPDRYITRAEVAAVTCRLLERNADQDYIRAHINELRNFTDVAESNWAYWYTMESANTHDYTKSGAAEQWIKTTR